MQIEGVPEGWEVVRWGTVQPGEWVCSHQGGVNQYSLKSESLGMALVVRKIERPKKYRPFANAEEYAPHFDRPVSQSHSLAKTLPGAVKIVAFSDTAVSSKLGTYTYDEMFQDGRTFYDDGEPFGVEVTE